MRFQYLLAATVVVLVTAALGAVIVNDQPTDTQVRTLRALYAIEPPFAFVDGDGRVTGEAPELLRVVARRAGLGEVEFVHAEFGRLLHGLELGRADVVASGMFITPERSRRVRFTRPTARVGSALLVRRGNPLGLHRLEDVAGQPDAVLAVIDGAVEQVRASRSGVPRTRIQPHADVASATAALNDGRADAFALSDVSLQYWLAGDGAPDVELVMPADPALTENPPDSGSPAFAVRLRDEAVARRLDAALDEYLGSAEHRALVAAFGFGRRNLPLRGTGQ
ncbi:MAG: transporter substrate-binding domain-containing protein [Gammaproteobacteria bacterium]|jgi:polar amino acid transport system substrate-binding protein|nr:transporter substrate-binding domain-containing protein [Gammaproteobacteria bacterium]MBU0773276.1 transporter substrate-binding domain-containing protein [Gammaproteobacteria bacterium]MBU0857813.1 transporter substrate-binding domain-containing protein [Gammaproteobacteria bacterium]MBU1846033.1 transporter substrate-binding domain-containing protein [Gammaproteobacteria bacterium]